MRDVLRCYALTFAPMDARPQHFTDWITLVLACSFLILAILHYNFPKRFQAFLRIPASKTYFTDFEQEKSTSFWYVFLLEAAMILGLSLFIYLITIQGKEATSAHGPTVYIKIVLVALLFITLQRFFHSLTGVLFDMKKGFALFIEIKDSYIQWSTPILLVLSMLAVYSPLQNSGIIYVGISLLVVLYLAGIIRASLMVRSKNLNGLQLFFYLCALELLPVLVLVKLVAQP